MKNIIKTAICLTVIASILLFSSTSHAATYNTPTIEGPGTIRVVNVSSEVYEDDQGNQYSVFTYQTTINVDALSAVDTYKNGYFRVQFTIDNFIPTGSTILGTEWSYDSISSVDLHTFGRNHASSYRSFYVYVILSNYGLYPRIGLGNVTFTWTVKFANLTWTQPVITPTVSAVIDTSNTVAVSALPEGQGFAGVFKQMILEALSQSELDLVYDYLTFWKTTQDGYLADIELSVDEVETWLSYINAAQATLQNKIDLIYTLEQTFPGYFNSMISILQQIRDMNASDTAAESQMQNAEQQLSQAVNDMEVQKPNINNVVNAGDQYMDSNITGAQGDTFFWLHGTNIFVTILTMAVTIGILGFVIYGKSG